MMKIATNHNQIRSLLQSSDPSSSECDSTNIGDPANEIAGHIDILLQKLDSDNEATESELVQNKLTYLLEHIGRRFICPDMMHKCTNNCQTRYCGQIYAGTVYNIIDHILLPFGSSFWQFWTLQVSTITQLHQKVIGIVVYAN